MAKDQKNSRRELHRYIEYFEALTRVAKSVTSSLQLTDVLNQVMLSVADLIRPEDWSLLLYDKHDDQLVFEIVVGSAAESLRGRRLELREGIAGWVATERKPVVVKRVRDDPRFCDRMDSASSFHTSSIMCVPLVCCGNFVGVIELVRGEGQPPFSEDDLEVLLPFADFAAIAIANARSYEQVKELTIVDEWTGLYNARFLKRTLEEETLRAKRYEQSFSLIFFDLDYFKSVNDSYGHSAGSGLLKNIGAFLLENVRETDRAIRYGGDEFVVLLPHSDKADAVALASRLRERLRRSSFTGCSSDDLQLSASFGVATFPDDATTAQQLLDVADQAMYAAKEAGRDTIIDAATLSS